MKTARRWLISWALLQFGCTYTSTLDADVFACMGDDDCVQDWFCYQGTCVPVGFVPPDAGRDDGGRPDAGKPDAGQPDAGCPGGPTEICSDGVDNNCNAQVDCAETSCDTQSCGSSGRVCISGTCQCGGNGGTAQTSETTCNDGADNDCDGQVDCSDNGCAGQLCGSNGKVCQGTTCACSGNGGTVQASESTCNDGHDNDCDGKTDCADNGCDGRTCNTGGYVCQGGSCACGGNGGTPEAPEVTCDDGSDNDCNGASDCADNGCDGRTCGGNGFVCAGQSCTCGGNGGGVEDPEVSCADGADNDCNGLTDCGDGSCDGHTCGGNGYLCQGNSCVCAGNCGPVESSETTCDDGCDNDCNGLIDCADPSCGC